ncbi:CBS domain-containing protein [Bacillaceae bacterium]
MSTNAERFLSAFNQIEKAIRHQLAVEKHVSFSKMLDLAKKNNPIVQAFEVDLKEYAELRNAIVHERTEPSFVIAEPHADVVQRIERIRDELTSPEKVYPKFKRRVMTFQMSDRLPGVLEAVEKYAFSQFPVYDGAQFAGLLTENGLSRFLTNYLLGNRSKWSSITLAEVMEFEKNAQNVIFFDIGKNLYEVQEAFRKSAYRRWTRLHAILITENGMSDEPVLGIVTPSDILALHAESPYRQK